MAHWYEDALCAGADLLGELQALQAAHPQLKLQSMDPSNPLYWMAAARQRQGPGRGASARATESKETERPMVADLTAPHPEDTERRVVTRSWTPAHQERLRSHWICVQQGLLDKGKWSAYGTAELELVLRVHGLGALLKGHAADRHVLLATVKQGCVFCPAVPLEGTVCRTVRQTDAATDAAYPLLRASALLPPRLSTTTAGAGCKGPKGRHLAVDPRTGAPATFHVVYVLTPQGMQVVATRDFADLGATGPPGSPKSAHWDSRPRTLDPRSFLQIAPAPRAASLASSRPVSGSHGPSPGAKSLSGASRPCPLWARSTVPDAELTEPIPSLDRHRPKGQGEPRPMEPADPRILARYPDAVQARLARSGVLDEELPEIRPRDAPPLFAAPQAKACGRGVGVAAAEARPEEKSHRPVEHKASQLAELAAAAAKRPLPSEPSTDRVDGPGQMPPPLNCVSDAWTAAPTFSSSSSSPPPHPAGAILNTKDLHPKDLTTKEGHAKDSDTRDLEAKDSGVVLAAAASSTGRAWPDDAVCSSVSCPVSDNATAAPFSTAYPSTGTGSASARWLATFMCTPGAKAPPKMSAPPMPDRDARYLASWATLGRHVSDFRADHTQDAAYNLTMTTNRHLLSVHLATWWTLPEALGPLASQLGDLPVGAPVILGLARTEKRYAFYLCARPPHAPTPPGLVAVPGEPGVPAPEAKVPEAARSRRTMSHSSPVSSSEELCGRASFRVPWLHCAALDPVAEELSNPQHLVGVPGTSMFWVVEEQQSSAASTVRIKRVVYNLAKRRFELGTVTGPRGEDTVPGVVTSCAVDHMGRLFLAVPSLHQVRRVHVPLRPCDQDLGTKARGRAKTKEAYATASGTADVDAEDSPEDSVAAKDVYKDEADCTPSEDSDDDPDHSDDSEDLDDEDAVASDGDDSDVRADAEHRLVAKDRWAFRRSKYRDTEVHDPTDAVASDVAKLVRLGTRPHPPWKRPLDREAKTAYTAAGADTRGEEDAELEEDDYSDSSDEGPETRAEAERCRLAFYEERRRRALAQEEAKRWRAARRAAQRAARRESRITFKQQGYFFNLGTGAPGADVDGPAGRTRFQNPALLASDASGQRIFVFQENSLQPFRLLCTESLHTLNLSTVRSTGSPSARALVAATRDPRDAADRSEWPLLSLLTREGHLTQQYAWTPGADFMGLTGAWSGITDLGILSLIAAYWLPADQWREERQVLSTAELRSATRRALSYHVMLLAMNRFQDTMSAPTFDLRQLGAVDDDDPEYRAINGLVSADILSDWDTQPRDPLPERSYRGFVPKSKVWDASSLSSSSAHDA